MLIHRPTHFRARLLLAAACLAAAAEAWASADRLPLDFPLSPVTFGGAGGGESRAEREGLRYAPVIMIPDLDRDLRDWAGDRKSVV